MDGAQLKEKKFRFSSVLLLGVGNIFGQPLSHPLPFSFLRDKNMCLKKLTSLFLLLAVSVCPLSVVNADILHTSSTFQNFLVTQNDTNGFAVTADVVEGGVVAGVLTASMTYGGGTNPFNSGIDWGPAANAFRIFGRSTEDVNGPDTADGFWDISVSAAAGFQVEGISVYSLGSALGNPDFINVQTNGSATVADDNSLLDNLNDGDSLASGCLLYTSDAADE